MAENVDLFDNIILNETVYIYRKPVGSKYYSKANVENLFRIVKDERKEDGVRKLFGFVNRHGVCTNQKEYNISGIILQYYSGANFIRDYVEGWEEQKLAYLFFIDFKDYLVIAKRNIAGLSQFTDTLEPLPYDVISKMLYKDSSLLESYGMDNMDSSISAMKSRTVAAENLRDSFNYTGAGTYILNFIRLHNDKDRYAISVNTSKLSKSGEKSQLLRLVESCSILVRAAETFTDRETPFDVFAAPHSYRSEKHHLHPTSVTILFTRLLEDLDNGIVTGFKYERNGRSKMVSVQRALPGLSQYIELENAGEPNVWDAVALTPSLYRDVYIKLNQKSITVNSPRLRNLKVIGQDGVISSIVEYIG